ncbi:MAG TPA: starch synthase, partial [Thermoanaerobaculia bacterium]|nr:starch synthase [Thermoanaerobaculia bacterium]
AIVLGSGEPHYEDALRRIGSEHAQRCRVIVGFDAALAHRIYAGCDLLLMPSLYEPCGLNQMYALRYGTLPVVRLTGGLADTVIPFDGTNVESANGFGFEGRRDADFYLAMWLGALNYRESKTWKHLQQNGMSADFSWDRSAEQYERIYRSAFA